MTTCDWRLLHAHAHGRSVRPALTARPGVNSWLIQPTVSGYIGLERMVLGERDVNIDLLWVEGRRRRDQLTQPDCAARSRHDHQLDRTAHQTLASHSRRHGPAGVERLRGKNDLSGSGQVASTCININVNAGESTKVYFSRQSSLPNGFPLCAAKGWNIPACLTGTSRVVS